MSSFARQIAAAAALLLAALAVGCSSAEGPEGPVPSGPTPQAPQTAAATPTTAPVTPTESAAAYDSSENMYRIFSGRGHDLEESREAIALAVANGDRSLVPVMIEMLRFFGDYDLVMGTNAALTAITGEEIQGFSGGWSEWTEWLGKNADAHLPPDGYVQWKAALMSLIDPRFGEFLAQAAEGSRINVAEIAWGGVIPDGIPDLQFAPVVAPDEQEYLEPSDRVFGVSINGEHRAYPLRIVNAHEMANDLLGGEQIALAY